MKKIIKYVVVSFLITSGMIFFALSHQIGEWRIFIVSSGSMEPTIRTGSLVVTQAVQTSNLQTGEIITFLSPQNQTLVTHRIQKLKHSNGLLTFITKGDNNKQQDEWVLTSGGIIGKVVFSIPFIGYIFSFLQTKLGILLFILLPSVFILFEEAKVVLRLLKQMRPKATTVSEQHP